MILPLPDTTHSLRLVLIISLVSTVAWRWVSAAEDTTPAAGPAASIRIDQGHPWRPPFGLERIGRPLIAIVELTAPRRPSCDYVLVSTVDGQETQRVKLELTGEAPCTSRAEFNPWPTQLVLQAIPAEGTPVELASKDVDRPQWEADAVACPDKVINPIDLGAILVPSDWLLLSQAQTGSIRGALLSHGDVKAAQVTAWFQSAPQRTVQTKISVSRDQRVEFHFPLPATPTNCLNDTLSIRITADDGRPMWQKEIRTMLVQQPPQWPDFGAVATKLRYDAPISLRADDGTYSSMSYQDAWRPELMDVVVALPNGSRFVFWRGSSYVPFWAGQHNTGLSYEWAETSPPPDGFTDCVEPLMDKELRYGRVQIVESTAARVHVRWSYQSCDFMYKVWGDSAVEDFYFYPDGFGTRVLTLQSVPTGDYELSEFIILTPPATYPLSVLPANLVDVLYLDGEKRELTFPFFHDQQGDKAQSRGIPAIYRVRLHKDETLTAVYYNPWDVKFPPAIFAPFFDQGELVTSTYWGSHWPLARGKTTGYAIDDRVLVSPCHNSVMSWARQRPTPLRTAQLETLDTLGHSKTMIVQTWAWLIGMSDADDQRLLECARSYWQPPTLEVVGARLDAESYIPERRAIRLVVESDSVSVKIKPRQPCVNPVFELSSGASRTTAATGDPPPALTELSLDGQALSPNDYAWDGVTLWINRTLTRESVLQLKLDPK